MSSGKPIRDSRPKLDDVVDLGSIPPPPGVVGPDVHAARTAIAAMPASLLEELRRAKQADNAEVNRTRRQEKFELPSLAKRGASFTNEAPTTPGKDGMRLLRPLAPDAADLPPASPREDLVSAVTAAIESAKQEELRGAETLPAPPVPAPQQAVVVRTPPMPTPAPVITQPTAPAPAPAPAPPPPFAILAEQAMPAVAPRLDVTPPEPERPRVRVQFLVALVIVMGAALVLAMVAIADRFFVHR